MVNNHWIFWGMFNKVIILSNMHKVILFNQLYIGCISITSLSKQRNWSKKERDCYKADLTPRVCESVFQRCASFVKRVTVKSYVWSPAHTAESNSLVSLKMQLSQAKPSVCVCVCKRGPGYKISALINRCTAGIQPSLNLYVSVHFRLSHFTLWSAFDLGVMHDENLPRSFHLVPPSFNSLICVRDRLGGVLFCAFGRSGCWRKGRERATFLLLLYCQNDTEYLKQG